MRQMIRGAMVGVVCLLWMSVSLAAQRPAGQPEPTDEAGFVPMFDGQTLAGWRKVGGGATYAVEDGQIVGRRGPGANTFLRTEKEYGDFILKLDVRLDVPGNSGVQFRSHQTAKGRVFGYQCEIDPTERAWSGGLYDEARRAWLVPLEGDAYRAARAAFKLKDWNRITIRAVGPAIQTWLNGVPCADLIDTEDLTGFIALQVHAGKEGQIRWRNVRLKDLGRSEWKPLFDGKSLAGWRKIGTGEWTVRDGAIVGTKTASGKQFGHLISEKSYTDFAVRLKFKAVRGNSGLYFRVVEGGTAGVLGFQAEINPTGDTGGLYETRGRAWVVHPPQKLLKQCFKKPNAWNRMSVVAIGRRLVVHVNGMKTAELIDDPGRTEGFFALQLHANQDMHVEARDIEVLEIPKQER